MAAISCEWALNWGCKAICMLFHLNVLLIYLNVQRTTQCVATCVKHSPVYTWMTGWWRILEVSWLRVSRCSSSLSLFYNYYTTNKSIRTTSGERRWSPCGALRRTDIGSRDHRSVCQWRRCWLNAVHCGCGVWGVVDWESESPPSNTRRMSVVQLTLSIRQTSFTFNPSEERCTTWQAYGHSPPTRARAKRDCAPRDWPRSRIICGFSLFLSSARYLPWMHRY